MAVSCDVIIPSKNSPWWLAVCLEELLRNAGEDELSQVIVVDDGSTADAFSVIEKICARHKGVRLLKNSGRPGFGGNCNFGVKYSTAPYLLFLNTDCLITRKTIHKLTRAFEADPTIGLACPLSNNSPCLTLPFIPGCSYVDMNTLLESAAKNLPLAQVALDACSVVGNCLLISRNCWDKTGEFSEIWGQGYGEESDYQMRAIQQGFRGVALTDTYVYHFGNGTFRYEAAANELRARNHALFIEKWGDLYKKLLAEQQHNDPVHVAAKRLAALPPKTLTPDVLVILPGLAQGVGGIHAAVDMCNHLVRAGVDAKCMVLGHLNPEHLKTYQEPMFAGLLHCADEPAFLKQTNVVPKCVVSTLFTTTAPSFIFAALHKIPLAYFVQGYECLFENGIYYNAVIDTYPLADHLLVTSCWLKSRVAGHSGGKPISHLPIGIDLDMFTPKLPPPATSSKKLRVGMVLRDAMDKGQWVLLELLNELAAHKDKIDLTVLASTKYKLPRCWDADSCRLLTLPLDRPMIASELATCDVFVDASFHEGFGLLPLEAMACGATVVLSDSGGINTFLRHNQNGLLVTEINRPDKYAEAILSLALNSQLLARLKSEALKTAGEFSAAKAYDAFAVFFKNLLNMPAADHEKKLVAVRQAIQGLPAKMPNYLVSQLQASVTAQDHRIKALLEERARMVGGISLKIGRRLTAPVRWIMGKP